MFLILFFSIYMKNYVYEKIYFFFATKTAQRNAVQRILFKCVFSYILMKIWKEYFLLIYSCYHTSLIYCTLIFSVIKKNL